MSILCPNCKKPLNDGSKFCHFCGSKIFIGSQQKQGAQHIEKKGGNFCFLCGAKNPDGMGVCVRCGNVLNEKNNAVNAANIKSSNFGKSQVKWFGRAAIAAIVVLIVIFAGVQLFASSPSERWIKENIPQENLDYIFEDQFYSGSVSRLDIVKTDKEMGYCVCYVEVLQNEPQINIKRFLKVRVERKFMGWIINYIDVYDSPVIYGTEEMNKAAASELLSENGFSSFDYAMNEENEEGSIVTFNIDESFKFADLSGNLSVQLKYLMDDAGEIQLGEKQICRKNECQIHWHIKKLLGEWLGEEEVYELFSGNYTNFHFLDVEQSGDCLELAYKRHRQYNDEVSSWDGSIELPMDYEGLSTVLGTDEHLSKMGVRAKIEGVYNIDAFIEIKLDEIEINGYNAVQTQTMNVQMGREK